MAGFQITTLKTEFEVTENNQSREFLTFLEDVEAHFAVTNLDFLKKPMNWN